MRSLTSRPGYPILATIAFIVGSYGATSVPADWMLRPLGVALAAVTLLLLGTRLVTGTWQRGGIVTGIAWLLIVGWGFALLIPAWMVVASALSGWLRARMPSAPSVARALNAVTAVSVMVALGTSAIGWLPAPVEIDEAYSLNADRTEKPDIFVVLLDAYARSDTLESWGYDNEPFLRSLEARGFDVYRDAQSSYDSTYLALVSMFHMRQIPDLTLQVPENHVEQRRMIRELVNDAPALDQLRQLGYSIVTSPSHSAMASLESADVYLDDGHLTEFERLLIESTEVARVLSWVAPEALLRDHANRIHSNFARLHDVASDASSEPRFVLVHVMSPHAPFAFRHDGSLRPLPECYPHSCSLGGRAQHHANGLSVEEYGERYTGQLTYLNRLVLTGVDTLVEDSEAIMIVMGDHGSRYSDADPDEWFKTLFAARTPGKPRLFEGVPLSAGILATVFNTYFGGEVPMPRHGRWTADRNFPLLVEPMLLRAVVTTASWPD